MSDYPYVWDRDTVWPLAEEQKARAARRGTSSPRVVHPRPAKDQHGANPGKNRHQRRMEFATMPRDWRLGGLRFWRRLPWR